MLPIDYIGTLQETLQPDKKRDSRILELDKKHQMNRENFMTLLRKSKKLKALLRMSMEIENEIEGYIRLH